MSVRAGLATVAAAALSTCEAEPRPSWSDLYLVSRSSGVAIVTKLPNAEKRLSNHNLGYGEFLVANDCLQVRFEGTMFTPILPRGTAMTPGGGEFIVGDSRIRIGPRYALPSAGEVRNSTQAAAAIGMPAQCAQRLLTMGMPALDAGTAVPSGLRQMPKVRREPAGQFRASAIGGGGAGGGTTVTMVAPGSA